MGRSHAQTEIVLNKSSIFYNVHNWLQLNTLSIDIRLPTPSLSEPFLQRANSPVAFTVPPPSRVMVWQHLSYLLNSALLAKLIHYVFIALSVRDFTGRSSYRNYFGHQSQTLQLKEK